VRPGGGLAPYSLQPAANREQISGPDRAEVN
jgi:hypothetical protein